WTVARAAFTCSVVGVVDMPSMVRKPRCETCRRPRPGDGPQRSVLNAGDTRPASSVGRTMGNVSPPWPSEPDPQRRSVPQHSQMWASPGYAAGPGEPNAVWAWPPPVQPPRPRTDEPPPGVPYHRMGRTERHRWWRPPLALGCAVPLFLGLNILLVIVVELGKAVQHIPADVAETGHPVADLAVELLLVIL